MRAPFPSILGAFVLVACSSSNDNHSTTATGGTGGGGGLPMGAKIDAPDGQWTWVPFDDAFCADGSTVGIGVNLSAASSRVMIYFEGGGACWSDVTCYTLMTATNFTTGYPPSAFTADSTDPTHLALPGGFFDRSAAANPFKDYSYVYVPYCTGDIHAGDNVVQYGDDKTARHVGYKNVTAYLARLVPTFPDADRVYVTGSSAGGFGALYNWWQTQRAFGKIRVDLIDDSGTPMPPDVTALGNGNGATQEAQWNLAATLPPGCAACKSSLDALFGFYATTFPGQRGALLSYTDDAVLPTYFGITEAQFDMGLEEELAAHFTPGASFKAFVEEGSGHVLWFSPELATKGITVQQFLAQMVTDDAAWASVHP